MEHPLVRNYSLESKKHRFSQWRFHPINSGSMEVDKRIKSYKKSANHDYPLR